MKKHKETKNSLFFNLISLIVTLIFLFNCTFLKAQFWKFGSNKKKINSLELIINNDRKLFKKETAQLYLSLKTLQNKTDSLSYDLIIAQQALDSLAFKLIDKEISDSLSNKQILVDSNITFCPDKNFLIENEKLKDCCCLNDDKCLTKTTDEGLRVISEGHRMAIKNRSIVKGSCWDFVDRVFNSSGFNRTNRENIYKSKKGTKFSKFEILQPGDWVYHVNYSFHNVGHSAIFICWKDFNRRIAITLSYAGQNKSVPGKYGLYDLSGIYNIKRPKN